ncbi:MAG: MCE family protein [Bacteroidales bacterium]|nr:MCE family protein [Candidatus Scybalocola fimicaballi]
MNFKYSREFLIGLCVIATVAMLYFGIHYLKGVKVMTPSNLYFAKFENVNGLLESSKITSRGVAIGNVHSIDYNYDDPTAPVVVQLQCDNQLKLPKGSKALLACELLGGANMSLDLKSDGTGEYYKTGDTIPSLFVPGMLDAVSNEIMPRVAEIIPQLDSLMLSLSMISNDQKLSKSIDNFYDITTNLKSASVKFNTMMSNDIQPLLTDARTMVTTFNKVGDNLSKVDFQLTFTKANTTLTSLNSLSNEIQNGSGSISLLLKDPSLYNNLSSTANSANSLLQDLEKNPGRYVQFSLFNRKKKGEVEEIAPAKK